VWPTQVITCSPLDAVQTDVMIDRQKTPIADFRPFRDRVRLPTPNQSLKADV